MHSRRTVRNSFSGSQRRTPPTGDSDTHYVLCRTGVWTAKTLTAFAVATLSLFEFIQWAAKHAQMFEAAFLPGAVDFGVGNPSSGIESFA